MKDVKVGTQINAHLLQEVKVNAARQQKKLREVFEEALRLYLNKNGKDENIGSIADSRGALRLSRKDFKAVMKLPNWNEIE